MSKQQSPNELPGLVTGFASLSDTNPPNNADNRPPIATIPAFPPISNVE